MNLRTDIFHRVLIIALPSNSKTIIEALQNLSQEKNKNVRESLLQVGFREILKWFTFAAQNIVEKNQFTKTNTDLYK